MSNSPADPGPPAEPGRPPDPAVLRQDVRKFTVQIRTHPDGEIVGTGIVVSGSGLVLTCAHVVRAAGVEPGAAADEPLQVYLPRRAGRRAETRTATVCFAFRDTDDDMVCLQLQGPLPLAKDQVAVLGTAHASRLHPFESYGYRRLDRYHCGRAAGRIMGEVDPPDELRLIEDPVQLESSQINTGMSGSAVLDLERNLVVGLVSEAWFAEAAGKDRDTAWAVNARLIGSTGLRIPVRSTPLPLSTARLPHFDPELARETVPLPGHRLDDAPVIPEEWVGREQQVGLLAHEWRAGEHLVVGLIGFGGEGKSSLARRWVEEVLADESEDAPVGVFWWSFGEHGDADEFLSSALEFMSAGRIAVGELPGGSARAAFSAGLLRMRRYVFVLDGLEAMQYQDGDQYGAIRSQALRDFLTFFATPGHQSFCLITSRAPVLDLGPFTTYRHIDVVELQRAAGRRLLRNLGVLGSDAALERVVDDWGGHALTLSLLAGYLVKRHGGDVRRIAELPPPDPELPPDAAVRRVLAEYDRLLTAAERDFLRRFSIFRTPVSEDALDLVAADPGTFRAASLKHLLAARVLRRDGAGRLSMHPLIRGFFAQQAAEEPDGRAALHATVARYYLDNAGSPGDRPRLEDLLPVVEAVHHWTRSGDTARACDVLYDRLYLGERGLITRELNAYETVLALLLDFFPDGRLRAEPSAPDPETRSWILHETATALQLLGRMRDAAVVTRRAIQEFRDRGLWHDAAVSSQNMAELHFMLGALPACPAIIDEALELARLAGDREDELVAHTLRGTLAHLTGDHGAAGDAFAAALGIAAAFTPLPVLYSTSGIKYADHLRRNGRPDEARKVTLANLRVCSAAGWQADEAHCHVGLGDLELDAGRPEAALAEYETAVRIAQRTTRRDVLIDALTGQARCSIVDERVEAAEADLAQALSLCLVGGYRLAEIDVRIAYASLWQRMGNEELAWEEATRAEQMSIEVGYHWGVADVAALLTTR
ncbi:trypsin-like peptidase domain-containing protein [Actinomadura rupiterrae]|uniref:trypsin-like peptidase domain-containing protein n=1 Tax=Actinomadura rupiterrae TaxID=559627 RepID=UPI0020A238DC|nr:trypsin-like peptidase domain-containing protein [Actinomadura rupiterrae]MCP2341390.1 tetratricopeptide (TPR) repeat protein [Actinomadura rupiterrae]